MHLFKIYDNQRNSEVRISYYIFQFGILLEVFLTAVTGALESLSLITSYLAAFVNNHSYGFDVSI